MSEYRTEVTGSAVVVMKRNAAGKYQHIALIPLADIPARADAGEWDVTNDAKLIHLNG